MAPALLPITNKYVGFFYNFTEIAKNKKSTRKKTFQKQVVAEQYCLMGMLAQVLQINQEKHNTHN